MADLKMVYEKDAPLERPQGQGRSRCWGLARRGMPIRSICATAG
jgi:hypothetical protein